MPVPVVWVGVGAAAAATAVYRRQRRIEAKRVLVVGPRGAGKTTLHALLTRGERSLRGRGTRGETFDFITKKVRLKDLDWKVSYVDSPSSADEIEVFAWAEHLAGLDLGIFVVDGARLTDEHYRANAELLASACRINAEERTRWLLVVSHADERPGGELVGHEEITRVLDDPNPQLVNLREWGSALPVVRRVVTELK